MTNLKSFPDPGSDNFPGQELLGLPPVFAFLHPAVVLFQPVELTTPAHHRPHFWRTSMDNSTTQSSSWSPKQQRSARNIYLFSMISCAVAVPTLLYLIAFHPATASRWIVLAAVFVCLISAAFSLASFAFQSQYSRVSLLSVAALVCCISAMMTSMSLAHPVNTLAFASKNLNGGIPVIAQQASQNVRDNPFNLWRVIDTLSPAARYYSLRSEDVDLFRQAHAAGVQAPSIDRVLDNGFVSSKDKDELLSALVQAYSANPQSDAIASLMASISSSEG